MILKVVLVTDDESENISNSSNDDIKKTISYNEAENRFKERVQKCMSPWKLQKQTKIKLQVLQFSILNGLFFYRCTSSLHSLPFMQRECRHNPRLVKCG